MTRRKKGKKQRRAKQLLFSRYFSTDYYGPVTILGTKGKAMSKTNNITDLIELLL